MNEATEAITALKSMNIEQYLLEAGIPWQFTGFLSGIINNIYGTIMRSSVQIFIFLAGLNSISPALYEACYIEGGNWWETFWKITFPLMMPIVLVNIVFSIVDSFTSNANRLMVYIYNLAFGQDFNFGYASALCLMYVLIIAVILGVIAYLVGRRTFYYT